MKTALSTWGALVANMVAFAAALALLTSLWVAVRDLESAEETLVRGEGESLIALLRNDLRLERGPPDHDQLGAELDRLRGAGLRYVAFDRPGALVEAGTHAPGAGLTLANGESTAVSIANGRARMIERLPPHAEHPMDGFAPPPDDQGPPPFDGAQHPFESSPLLVLEFEPRTVTRLNDTMQRMTAASAVTIAALVTAAIALSIVAANRAKQRHRAELDRRLVALGEMSGVMAHELRNPLASLKGNAQLLLETLQVGTKDHFRAALVVEEAGRLEQLTNDLLSFVRDGAIERHGVKPEALFAEACRLLPTDRFTLDLSAAPPTLFIDEARVVVALGNLLKNAVQASPADRNVDVCISAHGGSALIEVRDHGTGLPEGEEERIFEPFVTTRIKGTGLGLSVARRAAREHGGTLTGETMKNGGALFRMTLPGAATSGTSGQIE